MHLRMLPYGLQVDLSQGELNTLLHRDAQIEVDASTTEAQNFTDLLANVHDCVGSFSE